MTGICLPTRGLENLGATQQRPVCEVRQHTPKKTRVRSNSSSTENRALPDNAYLVFAALKILVAVFVAVGKAEGEQHLLRVFRETKLKLELQVSAFLLAWLGRGGRIPVAVRVER